MNKKMIRKVKFQKSFKKHIYLNTSCINAVDKSQAPDFTHSLILLNVLQTSDKSITLMRSRLRYFYLRIHFCPLTEIIKMDSSKDCRAASLIFHSTLTEQKVLC